MKTDDNKRDAMRFFDEVLNAGDMAVIDEIVHDDLVDHEEVPGLPPTKAGVSMWVNMLRSAFPDMHVTVLRMVAEGDEVWVHSRLTGTHRGEFMGIPPTEQKIDIEGIDRVRVRDGKAIEHWGVTDTAKMLEQMGVAPMPS